MFYSEQTHCSNLTAACLGLLDRSQMIKVTNTARRHWCRSPQSQKKKKKKGTSNAFPSQIYIFIFQAPAPMFNLEILKHR